MMPAPNLDLLSPEKLIEFSERHQHGREYKRLFPAMTRFVVPDTALLSCYASCRAGERLCKARGDIPQSLVFQGLAAGFYESLSPAAKWRK